MAVNFGDTHEISGSRSSLADDADDVCLAIEAECCDALTVEQTA